MATETVYLDLASGTAQTATLTSYYSNILVENLTTGTGATIIWARADGTTAVAQADDNFAIAPGESLVLNNGLGIYDQGLLNVAQGSLAGGTAWTPAEVQPYGSSLAGDKANPGSKVSVILDLGSGPVQVAVSSVD
jgi:hypothetical protein